MNRLCRTILILVAVIVVAVLFGGVGSGAVSSPSARAAEPAAPQATSWKTNGNSINNSSFLGTTNNKPLVIKTNNTEKMRILPNGNVGIGTTAPVQSLQVNGVTSLGAPGSVYGYLVAGGSPGPYPTLAFNTYGTLYQAGVAGYGGIFQFQDDDGKLIYYTGSSVSAGAAHASTARFVIDKGGNVGVGTTSPTHTLDIRTDDHDALRVQIGPQYFLVVNQFGVAIALHQSSGTAHVCLKDGYLTNCSSAAEYVPTIDSSNGFPETADLVSIAPDVKNPYGDAHGPFVVQKSAIGCDTNLFGFIVKPESGADGIKVNEHYLPLAIYGYFPAKVTMENGVIKRGDPITSSSKPGYGMKATGACKIVGYALEDANAEGTMQVFTSLGNNAASQVAAVETRIEDLEAKNVALREVNANQQKQIAALDARLSALEQALQGLSPNAANRPNNQLPLGWLGDGQ